MKGRKKSSPMTFREVLRPLLAGAVMFLAVMAWKQGFTAAEQAQRWLALTDACTVPGVLLTGTGLLSVVSGQGAFRGISFTVRKAFGQVLPEERRNRMPKTYLDYVAQQESKARRSPRAVLAVGTLFLLGAAACLWFYLSLS